MGLDVFGRIKDIVSANIDDLLSKAEDPEKMADQMVRKYEDAIKDLLGSTASVMASSREAKAQLDTCDNEIKKYTTYAERALRDGNEEKARQAITLKQEKEDLRPTLERSYLTAKEQADKAETDYRQLTAGLEKTKARAQAMKNTVRTAKVKEKASDVQLKSVHTAAGLMSQFDRMEAKAERMLHEAEAKETLTGRGSTADELEALYGDKSNSRVEDELETMKKALAASEESTSEESTSEESKQQKTSGIVQ